MDSGFVNELGVEGVLLAKNRMGLYLFENLKRALARQGERVSYAAMVKAAAAAPAFARRLDVNAPEFFVTEDPVDTVRACLKRTGQKRLRTWPEVARAILEGLAWSYRTTVRELAELTGSTFSRICMVGGGTRNRLLCRMTADATGLPVWTGPAEATAAGNVAVQAMAKSVLRNPEAIRTLVRDSFPPKLYRPRNEQDWNRGIPR